MVATMFHKNAVLTKTEYLQETGRTRNIVCLIIGYAANAMIRRACRMLNIIDALK